MMNLPRWKAKYVNIVFNRISTRLGRADKDEFCSVMHELGGNVEFDAQGRLQLDIPEWRHFALRFFLHYAELEDRVVWIEGSLPPSDVSLKFWPHFELCCAKHFYGFRLNRIEEVTPDYFNTNYFDELKSFGLYHFSIMHREYRYQTVKRHFANCHQIRFSNSEKWINYCKSKNKRFGDRDGIPETSLAPNGVDFDVNSFFSEPKFINEIGKLYEFFDLGRLDTAACSSFYRKYMATHNR